MKLKGVLLLVKLMKLKEAMVVTATYPVAMAASHFMDEKTLLPSFSPKAAEKYNDEAYWKTLAIPPGYGVLPMSSQTLPTAITPEGPKRVELPKPKEPEGSYVET